MDSRLDCLNLPVLKPHIQGPRVAELEGPNDLPYRVAFLMNHYFEWVGTFEFGAFANTHLRNINSCADVKKRKRRLRQDRLDTSYDYEIHSGQRKLI
jgi:hypothetical protein